MTNEKLTNAIGQLDEELLAEHFAYEKELKQKRVRRRMNWKTVVAIAACLAAFACVILFPYENSKSEPVEKLPVSGEASESVMIYGGKISTESGVFSPLSSTEKIPDGWLNEISVYHEEDAVPESVTVEIQGKNYTYKYKESYGSKSSPLMHMYGELLEGHVMIDAKTQKVISWHMGRLPSEGLWTADSADQAAIAEIKKIAENYAKELTEKTTLNGYEFVTDSIEYGQVYFYRYVNGHKTNEYIRLALTADKELCAYDLNNIGRYDDVSAFRFDEANAEKMIHAQLKEYYQNEKYAIQSMKVVVKILPTGQMAYEYWVETSTRKEHVSDDGSKLFLLSGETFCFIIPTE